MSLLEPGSTCWRTARAGRVAVLVDAAAYFSALREAILAAEHSVHIVGWDVDTRTLLTGDHEPSDGLPRGLLDFLNAVLAHKPGLRVHVLAWDFSVIYALERELLPSYKFGTQAHPRLSFALDGQHQVGASHHQKLVVIDDALAFCGGMDLTIRRWDTQEHAAGESRRVDPGGEPYAPMHDVQLAVDGEAARALAELVRQRWLNATGEAPDRVTERTSQTVAAPWPASMPVDLTDVEVGVVRTEPSFSESHRDVREVQQLTVRAIHSARKSIFIENQYLTAAAVCEALSARLAEPDGPEIVVVLPKMECGWLEQSSMGVLRERTLRRLHAADRHGRLHVYYPLVPGLAEGTCVNVHSKVIIIDDRLLKVGSSNLSNRSLGLDTECDLAIEAPPGAAGARVQRQIARVKHRLLGEHLGVEPELLAQQIEQAGSLTRVIEAARGTSRCLEPLPTDADPPLDLSVLEEFFVDPEHPMGADAFINTLMPIELQRPLPRSLAALALMLGPLAIIGSGWHSGMADWPLMASIGDALDVMRDSSLTALYVCAGFLGMGVLLCPLTILITFSLLAFGPAEGCLYAMLGSLASAALSYWLGRVVGRVPLRRVHGPRMSKLRAALRKRAFRATTAARLLPLGNFTAINLLAGALYVPFPQFLAGNLVGLTPGMLGMALFSKQLELTLRAPNAVNLLLLALSALALAVCLWLLGLLLGDAHEPAPRRSVYPQRTAP